MEPSRSPALSYCSLPSFEPDIIATNTLLVTNIPKHTFNASALSHLQAHFEQFGPLERFIPLKSFARCMIIYSATEDAVEAKGATDRTIVLSTEIRVYFGEHTPHITIPTNSTYSSRHLAPPKLEKNWLISPPGSPPVGWEQIREDPPNRVVLADDLILALANLSTLTPSVLDKTSTRMQASAPTSGQMTPKIEDDMEEVALGHPESPEFKLDPDTPNIATEPEAANPQFNFLISGNAFQQDEASESQEHLPSILVQDWDGSGGSKGQQGLIAAANQFKPSPPTVLPPSKPTNFNPNKAKLDAMLGGHSPTIQPTARPPLPYNDA